MMTAVNQEPVAPAAEPRGEEQARHQTNYVLRVSLLYHDEQTRRWAEEVYAQAVNVVGGPAVQVGGWNIHELNQSSVLLQAAAHARQSDVIVVAARAAEDLPLAFYHWAELWLPRVAKDSGLLVTLLDTGERAQAKADRTREYLRALAVRSRLDFLVQQRNLAARPASSGAKRPEPELEVLPAWAAEVPPGPAAVGF